MQNIYASSDLETFGNSFDAVKKSAFRLEMLDLYTIPEEAEFYNSYLAGIKTIPNNFNKEWLSLVQTGTANEIVFQRVRLVREPMHSYVKFEIAWGYSQSVKAGEKIGIIMYDNMPLFETQVPILKDFWLFDNETCYLMEYDLIGQFLGVKKLPAEYIHYYISLKEEALKKSVDIKKTKLWSCSVELR